MDAVAVAPTLPMVAALSANHLAALLFPPTTYQEGGKSQTYRSRWTHASADALLEDRHT